MDNERERMKSAGRESRDTCGEEQDVNGDRDTTGEPDSSRRELRPRKDHSPDAAPPPPPVSTEDGARDDGARSRPDKKTGQVKRAVLPDLVNNPNFRKDMEHVAELIERERGSGLEVGRIAHRWIGDRKYNRILNANRFADCFERVTGKPIDGGKIRDYVQAFVVYERVAHAGVDTSHLTVSHFTQIARSRCQSPEEQVELADRAEKRKATVRQIRAMGQRLHAELRQAERTIDVAVTKATVRVMDGLDLILEQEDGSIECCITDWQWSDREWGKNCDYPKVHTPADPVDHLCRCLEALASKLSPLGSAFLFDTSVGFLDKRIPETCARVGLKHAGTVIWQKTTGGFHDADTSLRVAHENVHILCREGYIPKALNGGINSVTPKWAAPTNACSGKQLEAVHRHQKPLVLMEYLISAATVNGLVVDPFAGSGTAGIAAIRRGCQYVGAELMPDIAEIANRRIALGQDDCEEVVEAINFFLSGATPEQFQAIESSLEKNGLECVRKVFATGVDTTTIRDEN